MTGLVTDEGKNGYTVPGGFRNGPFGIGIADVTRVKPNPGNRPPIPPRTLTIDHTRVDHYNSVGILIDGATGDYSPSQTSPLTASGVPNRGVLIADVIAGRNSCHHYNDFTAGGQTDPDLGRLIVGDCQPSGSGATGVRPPLPLYVGPDFGQDGVRVTAGASIQITGTTISSNFVHGANAPIGSVLAPTPNNNPFALGNHAENNQNLRLGAGVRLVGAAASSVTQSNVTDNAFGVLNTTLNGLANNTATPVAAQNDYWGLRVGSSAAPIPLPTPGPAVWPNTSSPWQHVQPADPGEPGERHSGGGRELSGGHHGLGLGHVLPVSRQHAVGLRSAASGRSRRRRSHRPTRANCTTAASSSIRTSRPTTRSSGPCSAARTPATASRVRRRRRRRPRSCRRTCRRSLTP